MARTATLLINGKSRSGGDVCEEAKAKLEAAGFTLDAYTMHSPGELPERAKAAVDGGAEMLIVGGGDGSLSCCVDFLAGSDCVFGLLPLGTANSFARSLNIPLDLDGAIDVIANGRVSRVDLGKIDDDYFCNSAAIGLSPLVAGTVPHGLKRWAGKPGYALWALLQLSKFHAFEACIDGECVKALEVRILNGGFHGGAQLEDKADPQSGEIIIQVVPGRSRVSLLKSWGASLLRLEARKNTTREFHGRSLLLETTPSMKIAVDGEITTRTPVTVSVAADALRMMLPR